MNMIAGRAQLVSKSQLGPSMPKTRSMLLMAPKLGW